MCRWLSFLLASSLAGQPGQAPRGSEKEPFALRSTTKLVQINAVAVDKKGNPVLDLRPEELQILENGKPQKTAVFGIVRSSAFADKPFTLPPNVYSNRVVKSGLPASVTIILLDGLNTSWEDQSRARKQVLKFLSTIRTEDRVALYTLGRGIRVLHDFTTETSDLIAKLDRYTGENLSALGSSALPYQQDRQESNDLFGGLDTADPSAPTLREAEFYTTHRVLNTLNAMEAIAAHVAGLPGRKSLIWVSGSFPISLGSDRSFNPALNPSTPTPDRRSFYAEFSRATRRLNHAGVSVYPVDARGLLAGATYSAAISGVPSPAAQTSLTPNLGTMIDLASQTGGRAFYHRNDIDRAIRTAADDGRVSYTIGYYPASEPDDKYHEIRIKVTRPDVIVRHRRGYFAYRDASPTPETVKSDISNALWSPLDATAVGLNVRIDHNATTGDLEIVAQLDPKAISLEEQEGRWVGRIDIGYLQKDEEGKSHGGQNDTITLNLSPESHKKIMAGGWLHAKRLPRAPKARFLRVVARDGPSGLVGSLTIPISAQAHPPQTPPPSPKR